MDVLKSKVDSNSEKPLYLEHILDGRRLKNYDQKSLLKHVAKVVVASYDKSESAEDLLKKIFTSFTKDNFSELPSLASFGLPD